MKLERAFTLITEGTVNTDHLDNPEVPIAAHNACMKTPKESATEHAFSVVNWGSKTAAFIQGAKKKGMEATQLMASMAYRCLKKPALDKYSSNDLSDEDDRANVW